MSSIEILGVLSAMIVLCAFVANEYKFVSAENPWYDFANFISALGLVYYAYHFGVLPFIITNTVWALVSGIDVIKFLLGRRVSKSRRIR